MDDDTGRHSNAWLPQTIASFAIERLLRYSTNASPKRRWLSQQAEDEETEDPKKPVSPPPAPLRDPWQVL